GTWGPDEGRRPGLPSGGDAPRHPTSSSPSDLFVGRRTSAPTECSPGGQPEPDGVPAVAVSTADATAAAMRSSSGSVTTKGGPSRIVSPSTPFALPVPE